MLTPIYGFLRRIASAIKLAGEVESNEKALKAYFSTGFRPDIYSDVNFQGILHGLIAGYDEGTASRVLEDSVFEFMSGQKADPRYKPKEKPSGSVWEAGEGSKIKKKLIDYVLVPKLKSSNIDPEHLLKGTLSPTDKEVLHKIKEDITKFLADQIRTSLKGLASGILKKINLPEERLMPTQEELVQETAFEKMEKEQPEVSVEKIDQWARKNLGNVEHIIFQNLIADDANKLGFEALAEKINKETNSKLNRKDISSKEKEVIQRIKERFYSDVREPTPEADVELWHMNENDLKEFIDDIEDHSGGHGEEIGKVIQELASKNPEERIVENIAKKLGLKKFDIDNWIKRYIKPYYRKWVKFEKVASLLHALYS
jgi:hypothetical protein